MGLIGTRRNTAAPSTSSQSEERRSLERTPSSKPINWKGFERFLRPLHSSMATTVANFTVAHHPIIFAAVETLSVVRSPFNVALDDDAALSLSLSISLQYKNNEDGFPCKKRISIFFLLVSELKVSSLLPVNRVHLSSLLN